MTSPKGKGDEARINGQITAPRIRLIDASGTMVGVVTVSEAIKKAEALGLDVVEISPNAEPPVCKIMDHGKYRYEVQKKAHEAKRKQKVVQIKEVKLRPTIDKHDLEIKLNHAKEWLADGDKVKFALKFRGREAAHKDLGMAVILRVQEALAEHSKTEVSARHEGNQIILMLGPK